MNRFIAFLFACIQASGLFAQDLEDLLDDEMDDVTEYAISPFLSTRVVNGYSTMQLQARGLDFRVSHKFGYLHEGFGELFGLDQSSSYFYLDYGLTDRITLGLGRATFNKSFTGSCKVLAVRQSSGKRNMPVTVSLFSMAAANTTIYENDIRFDNAWHRFDYTTQLLIGRKFNSHFSLQLTPSYVHRNLVDTRTETNDLWAVGIGARYKLTAPLSFDVEYFYVNHAQRNELYYDPVAVGVSYQTGGHVFQFILSNSLAMNENGFIGQTTGDFFKGDIRFGFSISQAFSVGKKKETPAE